MQPPERSTAPSSDGLWLEHLKKAAAGDERGLADLYDASSSLVFSIALRVLGNRADAEEVTLDVYNQVWRTARTFDRSRGSVSSWLVMLTRSRAIDRLRSRTTRTGKEEYFPEMVRIPSQEASPEGLADLNRQRRWVLRAMELLSVEQREAIELAYFSGMTHTELAEHLGQPVGTVKTRIRLGMMKLRAALEGPITPEGATV